MSRVSAKSLDDVMREICLLGGSASPRLIRERISITPRTLDRSLDELVKRGELVRHEGLATGYQTVAFEARDKERDAMYDALEQDPESRAAVKAAIAESRRNGFS